MHALRGKYSDIRLQGRMASIALRLALVFLLLLPAVFIVLEADHDCNGTDCAVCHCIQAGESLLGSIGSSPAATAISAIPPLFSVALPVGIGNALGSFTLIQQKVRLDV